MKSAPSLRYAPLRISSAVGGLLKAYSVAASAFLGANGVESENFGGAWSKQELFKGCALWYGVNAATFSGAEIEGGWGIIREPQGRHGRTQSPCGASAHAVIRGIMWT